MLDGFKKEIKQGAMHASTRILVSVYGRRMRLHNGGASEGRTEELGREERWRCK
jgi:hypothetical protein